MILVKNLSSQNAVVQTQEVGSRLPNLIPSNEVSGSANKKCLPMTVSCRGGKLEKTSRVRDALNFGVVLFSYPPVSIGSLF